MPKRVALDICSLAGCVAIGLELLHAFLYFVYIGYAYLNLHFKKKYSIEKL